MNNNEIALVRNQLPASCKVISFETFKVFLSNPKFGYFNRLIDYTRSYERGLEIVLLLHNLFLHYKSKFTEREERDYATSIYFTILKYLDKLDRWEDYLSTWDIVRENTNYPMKYSLDSRKRHGQRINDYILREDAKNIYVHFLWSISHRKEIIAGKMKKKQLGQRINNIFHAKQSDLSVEEIKERFNWLLKYFKTGEYDFNSPASKQRKKRSKRK
jgi:hypothetical protein